MSTLTEFRDHCRRMAAAEHKPECKGQFATPSRPEVFIDAQGYWRRTEWSEPKPPTCPGCVTDADRALFARLAGELDDYLAPAVDLFGEVTVEPMTEEFGMDERKAVGHE